MRGPAGADGEGLAVVMLAAAIARTPAATALHLLLLSGGFREPEGSRAASASPELRRPTFKAFLGHSTESANAAAYSL
jgi:hypothetical protein